MSRLISLCRGGAHADGVGNFEMKFHKKIATKQIIIPAAKLTAGASARLDVLRKKIADVLTELKTNIEDTDQRLAQHKMTVDAKRTVILDRNKKIQRQDKDLESIRLKLISRRRQNEFSSERNRYRKVLLVLLVVCNVILIGYLGYLITN